MLEKRTTTNISCHLNCRKVFVKIVKASYAIAGREGMPVTLGIRPDRAHTGYGYLEMGARAGTKQNATAYYLKKFHEKPGKHRAKKYYQSEKFLWNAGIFVWRADRLMDSVQKHLAPLAMVVRKITGAKMTAARLKQVFSKAPSVSIDYGLMEKLCGRILTVPVSMGWNDVGSWSALSKLLAGDKQKNVSVGKTLLLNSSGNFIKSGGKLIAAVGLKNLVVVESGDAILICPMEETEKIRGIVAEIKNKKMEKFI